MEKIERDFEDNDPSDFDDVLDEAFFAIDEDMEDDENETVEKYRELSYRPISEL